MRLGPVGRQEAVNNTLKWHAVRCELSLIGRCCCCRSVQGRCLCFFFSSRRRHTRLQGDWSSDVCSSDLDASSSGPDEDFYALSAPGGSFVSVNIFAQRINSPMQPVLEIIGPNGGRFNSRSGERRVGEEGRSRWAPDHLKKKKENCADTRS